MVTEYFIAAGILAPILFFNRNIRISHFLIFAFILLMGGLCFYEARHLNLVENSFFKADALGVLFLFVTFIISFFSAIHYVIYASKRNQSANTIGIHNASFLIFITAISGVFLSTHVGMLWAFLEASTLSGAALIYHDRDKLSLEATWKYLFVSSIGVTLGFAGIMFLSIAASNTPNYIDELVARAPMMNIGWLKTSFIFVLAGFSVKMGVVPFFTIDIDAKDSSPSPIGAMFSGPLMSVGFMAIFRFYQIYAHTIILEWMNHLILLTGVLSLFFAAVFILRTNNYKRMLAYSSMEHAGLILIAFSTGVTGYFVAILHLVLHAFAKAGMFFEIGQVTRVFNSKIEEHCGGYFKTSPVGSITLLAGLLCIVAMPPSGLFMTEFMLFKSLMISSQWWIVFIVMFFLCFFVYAMVRNFFTLIFIDNKNAHPVEVAPALESLSPLLLISAVLFFGVVSPDFLISIIQQAIQVLPGATRP
jgi:hydrogenase-4 component F